MRVPRRRLRPSGPLPKGAGGVLCGGCGAVARADGKGSPIILRHREGCEEAKRVTLADRAEELRKAVSSGLIARDEAIQQLMEGRAITRLGARELLKKAPERLETEANWWTEKDDGD